MIFKTLILLIFIGNFPNIWAAEPTKNLQWPQAILLPWTAPGIHPSLLSSYKNQLNQAIEKLKDTWLKESQSLSSIMAANSYAPMKTWAQNIWVGTTSTKNAGVILQPALCRLKEGWMIYLSMADMKRNTLIDARHRFIPFPDTIQNDNKNTDPPDLDFFSGPILEILNDLNSPESSVFRNTNTSANALHISFSSGQNITHSDQLSSSCLNLLLKETLGFSWTFLKDLDRESVERLRHIYGNNFLNPPERLKRATRMVHLTWFFEKDSLDSPSPFPLRLKSRIGFSESVFARVFEKFESGKQGSWKLEKKGNTLSLSSEDDSLDNLKKHLEVEKKALALAELPKISHIMGAWAYLDKGRAWGLKMDDRLVIKEGGQAGSPGAITGSIKGHVVGFFGEEAGLKSPQGYKIHEGAILFIRKGQNKTRVGQSFDFDPQTYGENL